MSRIQWSGDAMAYARAHVAAGVLLVNSDGEVWRRRIWTIDRWSDITPRRAENIGGKGYLRVSLAKPGGGLAIIMAHRLVYEVLVGPIPIDREINHKDLDKTNNRPSNLEVVTGAGNMQHAYANGRTRPWASAADWRPGRKRLTPDQIATARALRASGLRLKDIAERLGISTTHAHRITGDIQCEKE